MFFVFSWSLGHQLRQALRVMFFRFLCLGASLKGLSLGISRLLEGKCIVVDWHLEYLKKSLMTWVFKSQTHLEYQILTICGAFQRFCTSSNFLDPTHPQTHTTSAKPTHKHIASEPEQRKTQTPKKKKLKTPNTTKAKKPAPSHQPRQLDASSFAQYLYALALSHPRGAERCLGALLDFGAWAKHPVAPRLVQQLQELQELRRSPPVAGCWLVGLVGFVCLFKM